MKITTSLLLFLCGIFLFGCQSNLPVASRNMAVNYDPSLSGIHPTYQFFHLNDSVTTITVAINREELLFASSTIGTEITANATLVFKLYNTEAPTIIADSGTIKMDWKRSEATYPVIKIDRDIPVYQGKHYVLEANFKDTRSKAMAHRYLTIDKRSKLSRQNYRAWYKDNKERILTPYVDINRPITVEWTEVWETPPTAQYYNRNFALAPPPFAIQPMAVHSYLPDSSIHLSANGHTTELTLTKNGFYHINPDSNQKEGFTLFSFGTNYPYITDTTQLIEPLRYLSSKKEYNDIVLSDYSKLEVDKFWLRMGGDKQGARALINDYYSRVHHANRIFTSYTEGWRTDRGMTYIVFGPPNSVFIEQSKETWIYGEEGNYASWSFVFNKVENPFSDNDFALERSPNHKTFYHQAVETWREGRSFTSK